MAIVWPRVSDPRLHIAAVIMTIHVLGQTVLDFAVSVPQIAASILTCFVIEVAVTAARTARVVWPASAMLTGSGIGLIFRVNGTSPSEPWSWHRWWWFALVAAGSMATKYLVRWRGAHVFNPSNVGLVVAFLALGPSRVEPLEFWWHVLDRGMVLAYAVILVGGLVITARLGLLRMAVAFWATFAGGIGVLALAGHCLRVPWSDTPVCDGHLWWVLATSPEVLVFLFFMITDPRTVPAGPRGRMWFGVSVGALAAVLIAPQRTEFAAKVALLGALAVVCALRPVVAWVAQRWARRPMRLVVVPAAAVFVAGLVVLNASAPALALDPLDAAGLPVRAPLASYPLPSITFDGALGTFGSEFRRAETYDDLARWLLDDLAVESRALAAHDVDALEAVDHGSRRTDLRLAITRSQLGVADLVVPTYQLDSLHFEIVRPGGQSSPRVGVVASGTAHTVTEAPDGAVTSTTDEPVRLRFALRPATDGRWFIVAMDSLDALDPPD